MPNSGLYKLINGKENHELSSRKIAQAANLEMSAEDRERLKKWQEELEFWEEYARIYGNLEKAIPYRNLTRIMQALLTPKAGEIWLDVGCGPLRTSELIFEKSEGKVAEIKAIDIVLEPAREKLNELTRRGIKLPVNLEYASITDPLPYPSNHFDGIGANLVLPYVIDFEGKTGQEALREVLKEMFRILKPGGQMVWSTPKYKVNFVWVFLASIPDMLNVYAYIVDKDFSRILQGTRILKHALEIQRKGREGIYTFLTRDELERMLLEIGFVEPTWKKTFARQVWVNRVKKPNPSSNIV